VGILAIPPARLLGEPAAGPGPSNPDHPATSGLANGIPIAAFLSASLDADVKVLFLTKEKDP
jgi:hypothetical protein